MSLFTKNFWNLPNLITYLRILILPLIVIFAGSETSGMPQDDLINWAYTPGKVACWLLALAGFSDYLDGYLARKYKLETIAGALLDPLADKLTTLVSYTVLLQLDRIPVWVFLLTIGREFAVTSLRAIASARGIVIKSREIGKYKMTFQFIGGACLLHWHNLYFINAYWVGNISLYISLVLSMVSMAEYFFNFRSTFSNEE